jgi:hypothetical protein
MTSQGNGHKPWEMGAGCNKVVSSEVYGCLEPNIRVNFVSCMW